MKRRWKYIMCTFLIYLLFPMISRAENMTVTLNIAAYDTFSETIEIMYSGSQQGIAVLNEYNGYAKTLQLIPGNYELRFLVKNDQLKIIQLVPDHMEIQIYPNENKEIEIQVTDSAGLSQGANDKVHAEIDFTSIGEGVAIDSEIETVVPAEISWTGDQDKTGTITVTAPNITGMKRITYTLLDSSGTKYSFALLKENNFSAVIELPYGRYREEGKPEVIAEYPIEIPEETIFEYDYSGKRFGLTFLISDEKPKIQNPLGMKLYMQLPNGGRTEVKNLYRFSGDWAISGGNLEVVETGHYEIQNPEIPDDEIRKESKVSDQVKETGDQNSNENLLPKVLGGIVTISLFIGCAAVVIKIQREKTKD